MLQYTQAPGDLPVDADADVYSPDPKRRIKAVFERYDDIMKEPSGLPPARALDFGIELEDDAAVLQQRTYRMSPVEVEEVKRQLQDLLERRWIQPSSSRYGTPTLFLSQEGRSPATACGLPAVEYRHQEDSDSVTTDRRATRFATRSHRLLIARSRRTSIDNSLDALWSLRLRLCASMN